MSDRYILKGREVVKCDDLLEWARWLEAADRVIAKDRVEGYLVSTVFLGLDHRFLSNGPPLLFETMTFPLDNDNLAGWSHPTNRGLYSTYDDALQGHNQVLYKLGSSNVTEVEIEDGQIKRKRHSRS